jgi:uncharacterized RDD family membrane protein YckC
VSDYQQVGYGWTSGAGERTYAGFWIRFLAALVDGLVIGVPMSVVSFLIDGDEWTFTVGAGPAYNPSASVLLQLLTTVVGVVYYSLQEGGPSGQTIGKRLCGIRVVDGETGQPGVGVGRGVGRYFGRILSGLPLLLGYLWMLWDPRKQTWHDKLVRTVVVRV